MTDSKLTKTKLYTMATFYKVKGRSTMNKSELLKTIKDRYYSTKYLSIWKNKPKKQTNEVFAIKIQRWIKNKLLTKDNLFTVEEKTLYEKIKKYGWNAYPQMRMYFGGGHHYTFELNDITMERLDVVDIHIMGQGDIPFKLMATKLRCIRTKDRKELNKIQMEEIEIKVRERKYEIEEE